MKNDLASRRKLVRILSIITIAILFGLATVFLLPLFLRDPSSLKELFAGKGGAFIFIALQILQVFIALIPGEVIEVAAGYSFGTWGGLLLCYVGVFIASSIAFFLIKRYGKGFVDTLVEEKTRRKIYRLLDSPKRDVIVFLLYFIPGTPKDVFNFIVPLTHIGYGRFMLLSLTARLPSMLSSTIAGALIEEQSWTVFAVVYGATAVVSLLGSLLYKRFSAKRAPAVTHAVFAPAKPFADTFGRVAEVIRCYEAGELSAEMLKAAPYAGAVTDEQTLSDALHSCRITGADADKVLAAHRDIPLSPRAAAEFFLLTGDSSLLPLTADDEACASAVECCTGEGDVLLCALPHHRAKGTFEAGGAVFTYEMSPTGNGERIVLCGEKRALVPLVLYLPAEAVSLNGRAVRGGKTLPMRKRMNLTEIFDIEMI